MGDVTRDEYHWHVCWVLWRCIGGRCVVGESQFEGVEGLPSKRGDQVIVVVSAVLGGEVVDGYFCAVREKGDGDGAADASQTTGNGQDFVGEEGWEGRHEDEDEDDRDRVWGFQG